MKKLFIFLLLATPTLAQKITLKGLVTDSASAPLQFATVLLLSPKDSSLINFARTNDKGLFELKNLKSANYLFKITYVGHKTFYKPVVPGEATAIDMGTIKLEPISRELAEITIKGEKAPVSIKGDTVEFNADSFKVKPNSVVEDLLKKLPGVEVEKDGTVKAQGETVRRITVDGKEFFGRDPKMATKNLPADAIDKVQLYDKRSDQSDFTGIDDGQREKNINLKLKEDRKKGAFGSITAGGGLDERYTGRLSINRFNKDKQLSVLAMGNNVNQQGFSINDYMNFSGDLMRMMGGRAGGGQLRLDLSSGQDGGLPLNFGNRQNGFVRNWAGGLNFNNPLNKKTEVNGSYMFNNINQLIDRNISRRNFLPNGDNYLSLQNSTQNTLNDNHRLNFTLDQKLDSMNSLKWSSYINYNRTNASNYSISQSLNSSNVPENEGARNNSGSNEGLSVNTNLLMRHKFNKKGRTLSGNLNFQVNNSDGDGELDARNKYYSDGNLTRTENIRQNSVRKADRTNYGLTAAYTEPLGRKKYLEINYAFQKNDYLSDALVNDIKDGIPVYNKQLSNKFESNFIYNRVGTNFRFVEKKYNFSTGLSFQHANLRGKMLLLDDDISRNFRNVLPNLHFSYDFQQSQRLRFDYETNLQEPGIAQLAPITDNRDPLNIYVGNPNLKPEYSHRLGLNYMSFNQLSFTNFFVAANLIYTTNKINNAQEISTSFVQTSRPVNVDDDYLLTGNINYGFRIRPVKLRVDLNERVMMNRGINYINQQENRTKGLQLNTSVRLSYQQDKFDMSAEARVGYNQTHYSVNNQMNQDYFNNVFSTDMNWTITKNLIFSTDFDYNTYKGLAGGFNQNIPLWGMSVSTYFLKNRRGELKLSVNDLLNRNTGISRTAQLNFVQDERITTLGRYFLLSFTYTLKGLNPAQSGGVRIISR
ncbi:outer membrane beta-barrel family protein [Emticicia sp. 21SJ11W-3]|uniref:outer membrane beta-barrel family protein n=1 Tax=Emticicia sp. 21SJ11W-3 TaxID=2916755 RepID=UPI0020A12839|nr:outer membrane beta-barrel family protein [Emticicia sp. 21SJ11W-3]UTA68894.1 TonB-dependent receptor family protein [Emticicia sp. 21SJ11W-3]